MSIPGLSRPANWMNGKTCTDWDLTKKILYNAARLGGINTTYVVSYTHGATCVAAAYAGGVLAPNGRIYLAPYNQATAAVWHYIDTITGSVVAYTHGATAVRGAYYGGVLAPNGRIYLVPSLQATAVVWHYIDIASGSVVAYTHGAAVGLFAYIGGVLAPNGKIYLCPYQGTTATTWHYIDTASSPTVAVVSYTHGATSISSAYQGGVLAPNGRIYLVPYNQATAAVWHYIDTTSSPTVAVVAYTHGATTNTYAYSGGVLAPNDRIYLVPYNQATAAVWHYIDTITGSVVAYTHGATVILGGYFGGVLTPNGRIYLYPNYQATAAVWHYIDTITGSVVAYTHGATVLSNSYAGGILAPNGRIYLIPSSQSTAAIWHYIQANATGTWPNSVYTNPMFNKFR